jgi:hypothetical protein
VLGVAAAALAWAAPLLAAEPCAIVHEGAAPDEFWSRALEAARRRVASPTGASDCREVRVTIGAAGLGGRLLFRTRDGREATRALGAAAELGPTLEALLVTLAPSSIAPESSIADAPRPRVAPEAAASPAAALVGASLFVGVGARVDAAPGAYVGPHLAVQGQAHAGPWVAGLLVDATPSHASITDAPDGFTLTTYGVSFAFGRRHALDTFAIGYAVRAGVQVLAEEAPPEPTFPAARALEVWQPRAGLEGYGVVPLVDVFSLRVGASADTPIARFSNPAAASRGLPLFPRFGATATIGLEARLL